MKKLDINSCEDLERLLFAIINKEEFELGEVSPIPFALKFSGERFALKDGYISADFADTLVSFKREYRSFLALSVGKTKAKNAEVLFKVEGGSIKLDFLNDIPSEVWEIIGKMDGSQLATTIIIAIIGYFSNKSWQQYLEHKKQELETKVNSDITVEALAVAKKSIEILENNKKLEAAKNKPIKQAIDSLQDGEALSIGEERYTATDSVSFAYNEEVDDVVLEFIDDFMVTGFEKRVYGWDLHLKAQSKDAKPKVFWATSKVAPNENMKLFTSADKGDIRKLKVSMVKNKDKIKEAYIINIEDHNN